MNDLVMFLMVLFMAIGILIGGIVDYVNVKRITDSTIAAALTVSLFLWLFSIETLSLVFYDLHFWANDAIMDTCGIYIKIVSIYILVQALIQFIVRKIRFR